MASFSKFTRRGQEEEEEEEEEELPLKNDAYLYF